MFAVWLRNWHICSTIFSAIAFFKCVCRFEGVANVHICSDVSKLSLTLLCVILVWYNMRNHVSQHLALTLQSIQPFSRLFNRSAVYSTVRQSTQPFGSLFNRSAVYSTVRQSIQPFGRLFNRSAVYSTVRPSIRPFGSLFNRSAVYSTVSAVYSTVSSPEQLDFLQTVHPLHRVVPLFSFSLIF